jgi:hypothetical protein
MNTRPARLSARPFVRSISLYLDALTIRIEALPPGPRREAICRDRWQAERRYVALSGPRAGTR